MSKRYVLLKDIISPDLIAKAGDIGIKNNSLYYDENNQVFFDNGRYFFYLRTILQYPDWFKEITDTPPNPTKSVEVNGVKYLSPEEVLGIERKAFEAGKKTEKIHLFNDNLYQISDNKIYNLDKYPTFEDYKRDNP